MISEERIYTINTIQSKYIMSFNILILELGPDIKYLLNPF